MKVYKFGGASVRSAEGVKNLREIIRHQQGDLFVIVSAMGKTTNALEQVTESFISGHMQVAKEIFAKSKACHEEICRELFAGGKIPARVGTLFCELEDLLNTGKGDVGDYDYWYDRIVSYGELISTMIISEYLNESGVANLWIDIRKCFITDSRHRDANVELELSTPKLIDAVRENTHCISISQGFIGSDVHGDTTTLGREGSDYSAAVVACILDAESLTVWKDVEGVMNADPKIFPDAVHIPELTYLDAVELAYSGAQIIHPKTIKPLQNKEIPLHVRPFMSVEKPGSVIRKEVTCPIDVPVIIVKHNQILLSIRPKDFSFVLEERLTDIFVLLAKYGIKTNLIQSSAVNLSLCVDRSRHLKELALKLKSEEFHVAYNDSMQLLTIRGYTQQLYEKYSDDKEIYLMQKTRHTLRLVRKETAIPD